MSEGQLGRMHWTGRVSLHNEHLMQDFNNRWHRCFAACVACPSGFLSDLPFQVTTTNNAPLANGSIITLEGEVISQNDGTMTVVIVGKNITTLNESRPLQPTLGLNVINVAQITFTNT
ncbi:uncharacterized protein MELLADRAFT_110761 [Melampsora larici-populina 98AG31]|uniref:Uncharacterized protein n=1 Tax=Melampsora larici-populina (strain 98AG31 / pathotype 3-4-7) TaxID=747676 RepID=F4S0W0_MELLP|nr:uncharacterized protein MELLADRAFT_110761 [Melampsora larici-populina 98AG31]EGG01659.1 hypothetical protein MELLADRAFT_110761 [Melampsora larici-populina 98AG31]